MSERDNQALLEYVEEMSSASPRKAPSPSLQLNDLKVRVHANSMLDSVVYAFLFAVVERRAY